MDFVIGVFNNLVEIFPNLEAAAEFENIGRCYAAKSILVMDLVTKNHNTNATSSHGIDTSKVFFDRWVREGMEGQDLGDHAVLKG